MCVSVCLCVVRVRVRVCLCVIEMAETKNPSLAHDRLALTIGNACHANCAHHISTHMHAHSQNGHIITLRLEMPFDLIARKCRHSSAHRELPNCVFLCGKWCSNVHSTCFGRHAIRNRQKRIEKKTTVEPQSTQRYIILHSTAFVKCFVVHSCAFCV